MRAQLRRVFVTSLRSPLVVDHSTPPLRPRSPASASSRLAGGHDLFRIPPDVGPEECSRLHRRMLRPATGSAPASAVSVLFGPAAPVTQPGIPGNPRRAPENEKRSSNRAALAIPRQDPSDVLPQDKWEQVAGSYNTKKRPN